MVKYYDHPEPSQTMPLGVDKSPDRIRKDAITELSESAMAGFKKFWKKVVDYFASSESGKGGLIGSLIGLLRQSPFKSKEDNESTPSQTPHSLQALRDTIRTQPDPTESSTAILAHLEADPRLAPLTKEAAALETKFQTERDKEVAEIQKLRPLEHLENLPAGERILRAVNAAIEMKITGRHCWNWAEKVYWLAGFPFKGGSKVTFSSVRDYEGKNCGTHHASDEQLSRLEPGDWIFINNKNELDRASKDAPSKGNHSVIFLRWVDQKRKIAETASCPGSNKLGSIHKDTNLEKWPVTYISKPTQPTPRPAPLIA